MVAKYPSNGRSTVLERERDFRREREMLERWRDQLPRSSPDQVPRSSAPTPKWEPYPNRTLDPVPGYMKPGYFGPPEPPKRYLGDPYYGVEAPPEGRVMSRATAKQFSRELRIAGRILGKFNPFRLPWDLLIPPAGENRATFIPLSVPGEGGEPLDPADPFNYDWTGWEQHGQGAEVQPEPPFNHRRFEIVEVPFFWASTDGSSPGGDVFFGDATESSTEPYEVWAWDYPDVDAFPMDFELWKAPSMQKLLEFEQNGEPREIGYATRIREQYYDDPSDPPLELERIVYTAAYWWNWVGSGQPELPSLKTTGQPSNRLAPLLEVPISEPARFGNPYTQPGRPDPDRNRNPDQPAKVDVPLLPFPLVQMATQTQTQTQVVPVAATQTIVNGVTKVATRNRSRNRRPRGRVKERKVRMNSVQRFVWHFINFMTEGLDFVDVLHDALPARCKSRSFKPQDKLEDLWRCWDHLDVAKAVENYVNNQTEDMIYGFLGKRAADLNQLTGAPTGGGRALSGPGRFALEAGVQADFVPVFSFEPETGAWRIDTPVGSFGVDETGRIWATG